MSVHESRIQFLLEEILGSDLTAEEACREYPDLLPEVRERLARARAMEDHLDAVMPSGDSRAGRQARQAPANELPQLPGYHIEGVVGTGGMGIVYRARHLKLNRHVAIKMLLAGGYAGPLELERFRREAEAVAALCHPNIVQVFDAGECDGRPYFVMELVERGNLAQQLDGRPRSSREAAASISILARAVHAAHAGGIMHRDLKPGNILVATDGTLKIADFGLARRSDYPGQSTAITITGTHLGTPSYMAPEQALGAATEFCPLIDIYALGAILYELLTGRPPFRGETAAETQRQVISDEPVPPTHLNPAVPRDLQTICLKCLQKDPARRYGSAADLANDIERFGRGDPILARPVGIAERSVKWCRRRPTAAAAIAFSVVTLAAMIAGGVWFQRVENARHTERVVRQVSARIAIESELPLLERLVRSRQWAEAAVVLSTARSHLKDAESPELESRLALAAEEFEVARELDRIRESFPEPATVGYTFFPARDAYTSAFIRIGIGREVDPTTAATRVRASPLRDVLLPALDHAAFIELFSSSDDELRRLLAVAQAAASDPWQDRFHDLATWHDLTSLQQLVRDAPTAVPAPPVHQLVIVGLRLSDLGSNDATIEILRDAQLRDPADFWVNLELGNSLRRAERYEEAIQFYRTAVSLRPTHYAAWTTLGWTLIHHGAPEAAIGPLRKAVALQPKYVRSWVSLVLALANCGRLDEAQQVSREALAAIPGDTEIASYQDWLHFGQARSAAGRRDWCSAAEHYAQAIAGLYASAGEAWFELAAVLILAGDVASYRDVCRSMLERCEPLELRKYLVARAFTLGAMSEDELAIASHIGRVGIEGSLQSHWALTLRGALLCREGRPGDAVPVFMQSIQIDSDPVRAVINWVWLARAHVSLGQRDEARQWLAKAADWLDQSEGMPERIHLHNWLEAQILRREVEHDLAQ
ncbi:MAG: protein kinase [Phycisphaeraceae bacterium]|nr:protein kinase [Phycisphaeraceae bacterium]